MTRGIVLCADDYGQAPAISDGILALVLKNRLSAVSCLVNTPFWGEAAAALAVVATKIDAGLHFNLTEGEALSTAYKAAYGQRFMSLGQLLSRAMLRQLDQQIIAIECEAQLDAFQAAMGALPQFIDGHQHAHQFPVIREAVLSVYERRLRTSNAYIRLAQPRLNLMDFKRVIIRLSGASAFQRQLETLAIPHNSSFAGVYSFQDSAHYRMHFQRALDEVASSGLVMCHPALQGNDMTDPIAKARFDEYLYLGGDQMLVDCAVKGVGIQRFRE